MRYHSTITEQFSKKICERENKHWVGRVGLKIEPRMLENKQTIAFI